jgi:glucose-6-phosphate 1-dehydrogenase
MVLWFGGRVGSAAKIIEAKVKLLKCIKTIKHSPSTCFLGQFGPSKYTVGTKEFNEPGYLDDETVPKGSRCPTFASLLLQVDNARWRGVPFLMTAGKGLDERLCEVPANPPPKPKARSTEPSAKPKPKTQSGDVP